MNDTLVILRRQLIASDLECRLWAERLQFLRSGISRDFQTFPAPVNPVFKPCNRAGGELRDKVACVPFIEQQGTNFQPQSRTHEPTEIGRSRTAADSILAAPDLTPGFSPSFPRAAGAAS